MVRQIIKMFKENQNSKGVQETIHLNKSNENTLVYSSIDYHRLRNFGNKLVNRPCSAGESAVDMWISGTNF